MNPMRHPSLPLTSLITLGLLAILTAGPVSASSADLDQTGAPSLQSIGPLAFAPEGILFAADSMGASVFAIETPNDGRVQGAFGVSDLRSKIAARLGTTEDQIQIHDLAVHPKTRVAYLSVTRGQGEPARPLVVQVSGEDKITVLPLDDVRFSRAELDNAPDPNAKSRRGASLRLEAITDLEYSGNQLLVTGLSNEEFSSKLRKIDFPFTRGGEGTSVEIFHGAHGKWETHAPVRTLTTYEIEDSPHVLAAYTCTPLVSFPMSDLIDAAKVSGTTVAELGNRNRPLDMFVYQQSGKSYLLIANSSRGVMKVDLAEIGEIEAITERIADTAGLPYQTVENWTGVVQMARFDESQAMVMVERDGKTHLEILPLP